MHALQCPQCDPRNHLPQVRVYEPAPEEQGAESVTGLFNNNTFFTIFFGKNYP
jgi:hypothetical protein